MAETNQFMVSVAKIDAGMAILLTPSFHIIEFPSVLLPENVKAGSIIDMSVRHNKEEEAAREKEFDDIQNEIYEAYGQNLPSAPVLRLKNVTQTSIVLEWDALQLGTSRLKSLCLYKNNVRALNITNSLTTQHAKLSGLSLDTEYEFSLVLDTTAGRFSSKHIPVKTLRMIDLTGIQVCVGNMIPEEMQALQKCIERIHAKPIQTSVQIDTTHFICSSVGGREYERAKAANIPVLGVDYLLKCESEGRLVNVSGFYMENRSGGSSSVNISHVNDGTTQTPVAQNLEKPPGNPTSIVANIAEPEAPVDQPKEDLPKTQPEVPANEHATKQQKEQGETQVKDETGISSKEPSSSTNPGNSAEQSVDVSSDIVPPNKTLNKSQSTVPNSANEEGKISNKDESNDANVKEYEQSKQGAVSRNNMEPIQEGDEPDSTMKNSTIVNPDVGEREALVGQEESAGPSNEVDEGNNVEANVNNQIQESASLKDDDDPKPAEETADEKDSVKKAKQEEDTNVDNENRNLNKETENENQVNDNHDSSTGERTSEDAVEPQAKLDPSEEFESVNLG
ncbi:chs five like protein Cfr1 [Schizosaccharomyces cryophilus OY26]|uniref:Chs five like protein Cfr1 n=1 Tax=Schizosaccharomyces cryophilus (strain OY26 / ATCC MYA-4695 / CBS 11777 / NBRC 106824 / NRRL Y48691) TaxID=653667 RepID=S9W116_SCHCR|nr:chs five like protein Cfr1 [Schizosaccharomyces cryophilus OY26]EPY52154.1 chs five like protein Cfr1 [Schizosaccharomyces cryophilus OY26]